MRRALTDRNLLGAVLAGSSWLGWRVLLIAAMGEPLTDDERAFFKALTGREQEPLTRVKEFWAVIGRRGGKSRAVAVLLVYLACLVDHHRNLVKGERGVVLCLAKTQDQAQIVFDYCSGVFKSVPMLRGLDPQPLGR